MHLMENNVRRPLAHDTYAPMHAQVVRFLERIAFLAELRPETLELPALQKVAYRNRRLDVYL